MAELTPAKRRTEEEVLTTADQSASIAVPNPAGSLSHLVHNVPVTNPELTETVAEERLARQQLVAHEQTLTPEEQRAIAMLRGNMTRRGNRLAADKANEALDQRLNPSINLYKQTKNEEGYTQFEAESSERSAMANSIGHFWSGPEKFVQKGEDGNMVNPYSSGEYQAKKATEADGRMMAQTEGHKKAIDYIREHISQDVFTAKLEEEANDPSIENPLQPEDFETIQKDPENDLVYYHFRNGHDDIFDQAWGATSEEYASDLGKAMIPGMVHGAKDHAKFDDTVQATKELPALQAAAVETEDAVGEASRLNQIAALAGIQPGRDPKERAGDQYDNAIKRKEDALQLSAGAKTYREGADAQRFDSDSYRAAMRPQEELDELEQRKVWDKRTDEQKEIASNFEISAYKGTQKMDEGRATTLSALEQLKKQK